MVHFLALNSIYLPVENMFYDGYAYHRTTFEQTYRCYPSSFIDKPQIESGGKIIMPPSALDRLASLHIDYPMLFELRNASTDRVSHCGVLEFIAEEGVIYMPYWMMQNLLLQEGNIVRVRNVTLPKGTYVKLQPHTTDFLDIANPKAILETALRNYSCLTVGDSIMVPYNNKKYFIDIVEAKPSNCISIIETDCEVDFAPPLDYKDPERPVVPASAKANEVAVAEAEPKFNPFTGSGRRLDGRPLSYEPQPVAANSNGQSHSVASSSGSEKATQQTQGKLVFGSHVNRATKETTKVGAGKDRKQEEEAEKKDKFNAFSGKKYSLRG
ncbi:ubiquitin fusion degradation protein 1 homolog isoform X2 [Arabidopsis lyrata subsp. lyrata]|uniref:ubiquitin fusion degradation protein 1 homolog isoform X2 n=1 Tax=Arabidopsis lyrata subsp. lyrata TaxID=81972 RepID=UPI000A29BD24|nr:ubiquitin fusion degradation protein 1 homolog isoform X2 [Arabidopsis lyrata subsp. lyrata]|eukprot:XP_020872720.1 ubiquitin fusion degradation protein 1 homolog isoform X2 [Arabidopsis lyrata subsp. lyrata]